MPATPKQSHINWMVWQASFDLTVWCRNEQEYSELEVTRDFVPHATILESLSSLPSASRRNRRPPVIQGWHGNVNSPTLQNRPKRRRTQTTAASAHDFFILARDLSLDKCLHSWPTQKYGCFAVYKSPWCSENNDDVLIFNTLVYFL